MFFSVFKKKFFFVDFINLACQISGQVRMDCASLESCHLTCENRNTPLFCPLVCNLNGCQCPDGKVIDEDKNQCVDPTECPGMYPLTKHKIHDNLAI